MTLTKEKVTKNAKKYFDSGEKYNFMNSKLVEFLGIDFVGAPASTATNLHNSYEGGLIAHLLLTTKYAVEINTTLPEAMRVDVPSIVRVCCLHQIGKAKLYTTEGIAKWQQDRGINYNFDDSLTSMSVGERSAFYAMSFGVALSEVEYQAIINHDKDDSDKQSKWHTETLGVILRQANELAILEEKNG